MHVENRNDFKMDWKKRINVNEETTFKWIER